MDALNQLMNEAAAASGGGASSTESKPAAAKTTTEDDSHLREGTIVLAGCIDFDNSSKTPAGLEEPHCIHLGVQISKSFSSSSSLHMFFVSLDAKRLFVMGKNDHGQCGTGATTTIPYPVEISLNDVLSPGDRILSMATGRSHTLLLLSNGDVWGTGANSEGQLGLGDTKTAAKDALKFVKLPLSRIRDISCGHDHSMACDMDGKLFTWGHPQYGCLGFGNDGSFIKEAGKGPAIQYGYVTTPRQVEKFVKKDNQNKITAELSWNTVRIKSVAAGKNHSVCLEEGGFERLFSCGFGGYGRLGHNSANDEHVFREIATFQNLVQGTQVVQSNPQKQIVKIVAGSSFTLAISKSQALYYWGKMSNAPRGEATMYPTMSTDLYGWKIRQVACGSNSVFAVAIDSITAAWGVPTAGKFGLEGGAKSSVSGKYVSAISNLNVVDVSAGHGHVCYIVNADGKDAQAAAKLAAFTLIPTPSSSSSSSKVSAGASSKKRAGPAESAAGKKKAKG